MLVVWCLYAATAGVSARWLTWAARGIPSSTYPVVPLVSRFVSDAISTSLLVTVALMILRSVEIQLGDVALSLAETSQPLVITLAAVLGYSTAKVRELVESISSLSFLKGENQIKDSADKE